MRTHQAILEAAGTPAVARLLGIDPGVVKQWKRSDSIPGPYWSELARHGVGTLLELANAAEFRRVRRSTERAAA